MEIKEILRGYEAGDPQMVGIMTMIPITTKTPYQSVGNVEDLVLEKDVSYQKLRFTNNSEEISIVPHGYMYLTQKEKAQDRTVGSTYLVDRKGTIEVDADCLEPSQGGLMRPGEKEWSLLPVGLKLPAFQKHGDQRYQSLWPDVEKYLKRAGLEGRAIIEFFKSYKDELDQFVAQFEPVENQVGAIILFGDKMVGMEVTPHYLFWNEMWRPIIRDCYGSDAVTLSKQGLGVGYKPILKEDVKNIADLESQTKEVFDKSKKFAQTVVDNILNEDVEKKETQNLGDWTLYDIESDNIRGQAVKHGPQHYVYSSVVYKGLQDPNVFEREFAPIWEKGEVYKKNEFKF